MPGAICCRVSRRARPSPRWPSPRTTDPGTRSRSGWRPCRTGPGWRLDGHKSFVLDGYGAGLILAVAATGTGPSAGPGTSAGPSGLSLFAVDGAAAGLTRSALPTLDQTRKLARYEFDSAPGRLIGSSGAAGAVLGHTLDVAAIALAAEQLGGAQRALDMAVEYAKIRQQFGRPIGSFQAIKHRCADLLLEVESLRSAVGYAAAAVAAGSAEVPVLAALVKAYASEVYFAGRGREHPDPRRHRLHLGARRAPVPQASQGQRAVPR